MSGDEKKTPGQLSASEAALLASEAALRETPERKAHEAAIMEEAMSRRREAEDRVRSRQAERAWEAKVEKARGIIDIARADALTAPKPKQEPREGTLTNAIKLAVAELWPTGIQERRRTRDRAEQLRIREQNDAISKKIESAGFPIPKLAKDVKARDTAILRALEMKL